MAKAMFQKGQRVYVKPVGAWSTVERILPQWVRGVEEPIKVLYDVGLGRDFAAPELAPEVISPPETEFGERWRLVRLSNRWRTDADAVRQGHPHPGTYPVVMTEDIDWGGWRVPAAEYDRDPERVEHQARIIANALKMLRLTRNVSEQCRGHDALALLAQQADAILRDVYDTGLDPMVEFEETTALAG